MKVSFDFDSTLEREIVQDYAKQLIKRHIEVWIVTGRFSNQGYSSTHFVSKENEPKVNRDLFEVADKLGIPRDRIVFTEMADKVDYFKKCDELPLWHLDDDPIEIKLIQESDLKMKVINCWDNDGWEEKCDDLIFDMEEILMIIERNKERVDKEFFIDRRGKIQKYTGPLDEYDIISMHYEIAHQHYPNVSQPKDLVTKKLGWVIIGPIYGVAIHKEPSQSQINTLDKLNLLDLLKKEVGGYYVRWQK